jgi:hypothetical protein
MCHLVVVHLDRKKDKDASGAHDAIEALAFSDKELIKASGSEQPTATLRAIAFIVPPDLDQRSLCRLMCRWFVNVPWLLRIDVVHM